MRVTEPPTRGGEISAITHQPCASCRFYFNLSVNSMFGFYLIMKCLFLVFVIIIFVENLSKIISNSETIELRNITLVRCFPGMVKIIVWLHNFLNSPNQFWAFMGKIAVAYIRKNIWRESSTWPMYNNTTVFIPMDCIYWALWFFKDDTQLNPEIRDSHR